MALAAIVGCQAPDERGRGQSSEHLPFRIRRRSPPCLTEYSLPTGRAQEFAEHLTSVAMPMEVAYEMATW